MKHRLLLLPLACVVSLAAAETSSPAPAKASATEGATAARILEHVKVLSSDEFEGRAPGSPVEEKTVAYLVSEFKKLGLQPGNPDGTYIQNVPLVGITSAPALSFTLDGRTMPLENINEFIGPSSRIAPHVEAKATTWSSSVTAWSRLNSAGMTTRASMSAGRL